MRKYNRVYMLCTWKRPESTYSAFSRTQAGRESRRTLLYLFRVVCRNLLVCRQKRRRTKNDMRHGPLLYSWVSPICAANLRALALQPVITAQQHHRRAAALLSQWNKNLSFDTE